MWWHVGNVGSFYDDILLQQHSEISRTKQCQRNLTYTISFTRKSTFNQLSWTLKLLLYWTRRKALRTACFIYYLILSNRLHWEKSIKFDKIQKRLHKRTTVQAQVLISVYLTLYNITRDLCFSFRVWHGVRIMFQC